MAHITDERLKEMEEEMNRFEHEIAIPANDPNILINMNMMGNGTTIPQDHRPLHFIPHQLHNVSMGHGGPSMQQFPAATMGQMVSALGSSPAVYMAQPVKTVTVQASVIAAPEIQNYAPPMPPPPPLAPPPPPPAAMNFMPVSILHPRGSDNAPKSHSEHSRPVLIRPVEEIKHIPLPPSSSTGSKKTSKKKKIVRNAGNQIWEDNSLLDWDPDDFRIFCGDLGNDVTDEVLMRTFGRYPSFGKAKVIRDKRTNKTKGYGFVSFKDPQDFIKAMREMNGKYVGSRPIKLRKSTWKDRNIEIVKKKMKEKERLGLA